MKENLLEKYILQQLSTAEQVQFEQIRQTDEAFSQEVELIDDIIIGMQHYWSKKTANTIAAVDQELQLNSFFERLPNSNLEQALIKGIQSVGAQELSQKIGQVDQELANEGFFEPTNQSAKTPIIQLLVYAVAAASILLVLTFGWQQMNTSTSPQEQFASYFEAYPDQLSGDVEYELSEQGFAGNPDEAQLKALLVAMDSYEAKNYAVTINSLTDLLEKNQVDKIYQPNARFYLGLSYLATGKTTEALNQFQQVKSDRLGFHIHWYTALAHLKNENIGLAKQELLEIKSSDLYKRQATALLESL